MKRMIAFLIAILCLFGNKFLTKNDMPNFDFEKLMIITTSSNDFDVENIQNGNQYYYYFDKNEGQKQLEKIDLKGIEGLVFYLSKDQKIEEVKNQIDFVYEGKEEIDGIEIFYGYDKSFPIFSYIDGKKVNVQIVENSTNIIIGFPMILCGY